MIDDLVFPLNQWHTYILYTLALRIKLVLAFERKKELLCNNVIGLDGNGNLFSMIGMSAWSLIRCSNVHIFVLFCFTYFSLETFQFSHDISSNTNKNRLKRKRKKRHSFGDLWAEFMCFFCRRLGYVNGIKIRFNRKCWTTHNAVVLAVLLT